MRNALNWSVRNGSHNHECWENEAIGVRNGVRCVRLRLAAPNKAARRAGVGATAPTTATAAADMSFSPKAEREPTRAPLRQGQPRTSNDGGTTLSRFRGADTVLQAQCSRVGQVIESTPVILSSTDLSWVRP